jgi:hypothetical protein
LIAAPSRRPAQVKRVGTIDIYCDDLGCAATLHLECPEPVACSDVETPAPLESLGPRHPFGHAARVEGPGGRRTVRQIDGVVPAVAVYLVHQRLLVEGLAECAWLRRHIPKFASHCAPGEFMGARKVDYEKDRYAIGVHLTIIEQARIVEVRQLDL